MTSTTGRTLERHHHDYLVSEGISPDYIEAHPEAFWSYDGATVFPDGFEWVEGTPAHTDGGIVFTWPQVDGSAIWQLRPDTPAIGSKGPVKYVGPARDADDGSVLSYGLIKTTMSADAPVYVVEGTKQARAAASALAGTEAVVVGLPGIQAWVKGVPGSLSASGAFRGRQVYVVADADAATNRAVYDGALAVGVGARTAGAKGVRYIQVPKVVGPNTGLDDFLATLDVDARCGELVALAGSALPKPAAAAPRAKRAIEATDYARALDVDPNNLWDGDNLDVDVATKALLEDTPAAFMSSGTLAWYRDGAYRPAEVPTDRHLQAQVGRLLGGRTTTGRMANIKVRLEGAVTASGRVIPEQMDEPIVNHRGGLLDLRTGVNHPHTPDHLCTVQLAVDIDMDGACPLYDEWINERVGPLQAEALDALVAAALDPSTPSEKVAFLFGPSRSGKSTFLTLVREAFGADQVSGVTLHQMENSQYAPAELYGKAVNIGGDLSAADLRDLSNFKMLTGGDVINASKKYGVSHNFVSRASQFFSANTPPQVSTDEAYYNRIVPVSFPAEYAGKEDPEVERALLRELPAIVARWARAYGRKPFALPVVNEVFRESSDRVSRFLAMATVPCDTDVEPGVTAAPGTVATPGAATITEVYKAFLEWAEAEGGMRMKQANVIGRLEDLGVERITVGAKKNKRVLNIRILDPDTWYDGEGIYTQLNAALWPEDDGDDPTDPDDGDGPTDPDPEPTPPAPDAPADEAPAEPASVDLTTYAPDLAAHVDTPVLDEDLARALLAHAVTGDEDSTHAMNGRYAPTQPTVTLEDLTAAGPLGAPRWTRAALSTLAPTLDALGVYVRERRLRVAGDLSTWDARTTGQYVSKADRAELKNQAREALSDAAAVRKENPVQAQAYRDHSAVLRLQLAASESLPDALTAYAITVDADRLAAHLGR